ncbi:MAG: amidase [Candidatus Competibacteraceae bacterium]|nr:amidase [Candidatus Competibacteraceae bacterium]
MATYDLDDLHLPRLSGWPLKLLSRLLENPLTAALPARRLLRDAGLPALWETHLDQPPCLLPPVPCSSQKPVSPPIELPAAKGPFNGAGAYTAAYRNGHLTPEQVAEATLEAIAADNRQALPLRAFIAVDRNRVLAQAQEATRRWRQGRPLGPLDGVPVAVKDELDVVGYGTTLGTAFLGRTPAREDAPAVARLRAAGAVILGKTNMHEIGLGVTGLNVHHGTARNPYHRRHYPGGSSSGSAVAVAAGYCPLAVGADGGGSIRIPAAFCGLFGLKPTYGRISPRGSPLPVHTVGSFGPLAATSHDLALAYALMAGPDPDSPATLGQPPVVLEGPPDLEGVTLGIYRPWFEHADPAVVAVCQRLLTGLQEAGAAAG